MNKRNAAKFIRFMVERHSIYLRRKDGLPHPWAKDRILQTYRFCNVYRELDTVTIWIRKHIREPFKDHPHLWFMLCMARQINWPDTLEDLIISTTMGSEAWPTGNWKWRDTLNVMRNRKKAKKKVYTGAYIINAQYGHAEKLEKPENRDKPLFTCKYVLKPLWDNRAALYDELFNIPAGGKPSLENTVNVLKRFRGWGGFTAYEAACDMRYTHLLKNAPDKMTYANTGPGARRGLNRIFGRPVKGSISEAKTLQEMIELLPIVQSQWPKGKDWPKLELREIEHSLCEFDKYERVRLGEGRPRAIYKPATPINTDEVPF